MKHIRYHPKNELGTIVNLGNWGELPVRVNILQWKSASDSSVDELHIHRRGTETYIILQGSAVLEVSGQEISVDHTRAVMIEPGEPHRLLSVEKYPYVCVVVNSLNDANDRQSIV